MYITVPVVLLVYFCKKKNCKDAKLASFYSFSILVCIPQSHVTNLIHSQTPINLDYVHSHLLTISIIVFSYIKAIK